MTHESPLAYQRPSRQWQSHSLTIGKLLGVTGCFAILFTLIAHVQTLGFWFLSLAVLPLLGGIHGTYKNGFKGFLEGAICGALLMPICLLLLCVVLMWIFLISLILSPFVSG